MPLHNTMNQTTVNCNTFRTEGVMFPIPIFSKKEVLSHKAEFELMEKAFNGKLPYAGNLHFSLLWAYELSTHPKILDFITPILGDDISVVGTLMLTKYPKTDNYVSWHQDGMNSKWDQNNSLTAWLALTNSNAGNGCMQVIPKSHENLLQEHVYFTDQKNMIRKGHRIATNVNEEEALDLELRSGEMSIHHNSIIHGSKPNASLQKRIGFIIRYINTKYVNPGTSVIYAKGNTKYDHLNKIDKPDAFGLKHSPEAYKDFLTQNIVIK